MIWETATVDGEQREAVFSNDRYYRYRLDIEWGSGPKLVTIGLNPSTADHLKDDPTIRKCKALARRLGCGSYRMLNVFAFRATDYRELRKEPDPVGFDNTIDYLANMSLGMAVACWGTHVADSKWKWRYRGHDIAAAIPTLFCLRKTKDGHPEHPLYLPNHLTLKSFSYGEKQDV